jgi:hypothetical protein
MTARCQRVFLAGLVVAFVALFRGGAVTLGCSFVVVSGGGVGFFRHGQLLPGLKHEGAQCEGQRYNRRYKDSLS